MRIRSMKPLLMMASPIDPDDRPSWKQFTTAPPGAELLYRLYSADMELLYVGITWNPFVRWTDHSKTKAWWGAVALAEVYLCRDDRDARDWETWCIKTLEPKHNIHQNARRS